MKRIACLLALLCTGPLAAQDSDFAAIGEKLSSLEKTTIDAVIQTKEPLPLREFLGEICTALPTKPSIVYKEGVDTIVVPKMALERVRFGDLLEALESLLNVTFEIKNPNPEKGQASLIIVEADGALLGARVGTGFGSLGGGTVRKPKAGGTGGGIKEGGGGGRLTPGIKRVVPNPATGSETAAGPNGKVITGFLEVAQDGGAFSTSWVPSPESKTPVTRTYAIGSLVDGGHKANDVIEAINLVWTTSDPEMVKNIKVAHHEPSHLVIIKAFPKEQDLADEVIQKLEAQVQNQRGDRSLTHRLQRQDEEFERERHHVEKLHRIVLDQLKDSHQSEVKKLRSRITELESVLDELRNQVKGGN